MESEENNYPVPLLDEECKNIINQEKLDSTNNYGLGLTKLKSQSDDKKVIIPDNRRNSLLDKNKILELKPSIKNSPISVKKSLNVKIDDKFSLNLQDMAKTSKPIMPSQKQTSSSKDLN